MKKYILMLFLFILSCSKDEPNTFSGVFTGDEYLIKSQVSGIVERVNFHEGAKVKKGDTLLVIDHREVTLQIKSLEYTVRDLMLQVNNAKEDLEKAEKLFKSSAITEDSYKRTARRYKSLLLELNAAKYKLLAQKENLKKFFVTSPVDGYVNKKMVNTGETVLPGMSIVELVRPEKVYLNIYVPEDKLPTVKMGQEVDIHIDAYKGRTFRGKVVFISEKAEFTPKTIQTKEERVFLVFRVKIMVENPELVIKPGIYGDAVLK